MTADQKVERDREEPLAEERGGLSGSINIGGFRHTIENQNEASNIQDPPEPLEPVGQSQKMPEETSSQEDKLEIVTLVSNPTEIETPFDLVEELKRKKIKPAA